MEQDKYKVEVRDSGVHFFCGPEETLLEAMKRSGCGPIHYGCFGGGCGICKMKIVSGRYSVIKKMSRAHITEDEQAAGIVLICCVKLQSDLTIVRI